MRRTLFAALLILVATLGYGLAQVPGTRLISFSSSATTTTSLISVARGPLTTAVQAKAGTFTANGTSTVTIVDAAVTANSMIVITLKTVGGTVGAIPAVTTITAGTGFTTAGTASDTFLYNYLILG